MRILLTIIGYLIVVSAMGQAAAPKQYISLRYEQHKAYVGEASEAIEAVSQIPSTAQVEYRAGHSVTLLPGFQANAGSVFMAHISLVPSESNFELTAFPNPFDQSTTIGFTLPRGGIVSLIIVDEQGRIINRLLENSLQTEGRHYIEWKAETLLPGTYIPVLHAGNQQTSKKILKK